ncbi:MAG: glycosyltransferase family 9 protein [Verrucomicrobia bacterium]|jgi:heptosyltransferase III|nr:glycosyltransferase family 9 protein [Verrucomicrobiota bacterium]
MATGRILIIRGGAIGDFVLTLPVLQALRDNFPEAKVDVLGYPKIANLAKIGGLANETKAIEAQAVASFFARNGTLDKEWEAYFAAFEIIISFLYDPDDIFKTNVGRCSKAQFIQGPHRPSETEDIHATDVFLEPLEQLAIFEADNIPRLTLTEKEPPTSSPHSYLAIHPGSGSKSKNWPIAQWIDLIKILLTQTDWHFLIVGGEAEENELKALQSTNRPDRIRFEISLPLDKLAPMLARCEGFVGHDSGISHLAAALGIPGLVIWGPSNESVWRPKSESVIVINHADGLEKLPIEQVLARIPAPKKKG